MPTPPNLAQAEARLAAAPTGAERITALIELASAVRNKDPKRAADAAREAAELAKSIGNTALRAHALAHYGAAMRGLTELATAIQIGREATEIYNTDAINDPPNEAFAYLQFGVTHILVGQMTDALSAFERSRSICQRIGDRSGEAEALMDIATVYSMLGDAARATSLYEDVLPIYEMLHDNYHVASALNNAAYAYVLWGIREATAGNAQAAQPHFAKAIEMVRRALPLAEQTDHPDFLVACLDTLATAYRETGNYAECFATLDRQLSIARVQDGRRMEALTLGNLGESHRRAGNLELAIQHLEASDQASSALGLTEQHADTLNNLVLAYEQAGRFHDALAIHRRYHKLETQLKSKATEEKMRVLETRLTLEKTQTELASARQREEELASVNAQLSEADREKSILVAKLERQSFEDALTGLHNRRSLDERLAVDFRRARRYGGPLSVALSDLDFFKQINDRLSHAVGDDVLRVISRILRDGLRTTDFVARYGGEEFALIFPETPLEQAQLACEKIRALVEGYDWKSVHPDLAVTISFGVTEMNYAFNDPDELLAVADKHLYQAKFNGKNQVCAGQGDPAAIMQASR